MKVVALAGGVGGAKLVDGLAQVLPAEDLTTIVNTGDDFFHYGLNISPDIDTVCYTLAGLANPVTGWGRIDETWDTMQSLQILGGPDWFNLGDKDLATHLERTRRLQEGQKLSLIVKDFCEVWNIESTILPMSDDDIRTIVITREGELPFQDYFVKKQCRPEVKGFKFLGIDSAVPAPGVIQAIKDADLLLICPSNPWVSIDPIISVPGIKSVLLEQKKGKIKIFAVSPIIGGHSVKGPAGKMFTELGIEASAYAVAEHYQDIVDVFIFDFIDSEMEDSITELNMVAFCAQTLMKTRSDRKSLAETILNLY